MKNGSIGRLVGFFLRRENETPINYLNALLLATRISLFQTGELASCM